MPEFTYAELSAESTRLGLTSAHDSDFTPDEIAEAVAGLADYHLTARIASLSGKTFTAATIGAFAKLAQELGANVTSAYEGLEISRDTTAEERRASALQNLKSRHSEANRKIAKTSLEKNVPQIP